MFRTQSTNRETYRLIFHSEEEKENIATRH